LLDAPIHMQSLSIVRFPLLATLLLGCADDPDALTPVPPSPTQTADVDAAYDALDNACNDGHVTRALTAVNGIDANNLWSTPVDDAAGLGSAKLVNGGWRPLVAVAKVTFDGVSESLSTTSAEQAARCDAAREIVTPITRDGRTYFTNLLMFAGEHAHLDAIPASGALSVVDAPVRLRGYLHIASAIREEVNGGVLYSDVQEQHVPVSIACTRPLRVARELVTVSSADAARYDAATCQPTADGARCLVERVMHAEVNSCTIVATGAIYIDPDGPAHRLSLGAHAHTNTGVTYSFTVDRFEFHAP
jgi:hypothetical protein